VSDKTKNEDLSEVNLDEEFQDLEETLERVKKADSIFSQELAMDTEKRAKALLAEISNMTPIEMEQCLEQMAKHINAAMEYAIDQCFESISKSSAFSATDVQNVEELFKALR
jgi:ElaB/YqjD/DUF883 family membrane-anchored ribosome-binding protein